MKKLVIIGASGHGKVIADIARNNHYQEIVFLDDDLSVKACGGYPCIGTSDKIEELDADFIVGIGNAKSRQRLQERVKQAKKSIPVLIHPNAVIAENVQIGEGTVIMAGVVVNPGTKIGDGCIINTCASVDHDCILGDYVHISVGAHLAGTVSVGNATWIGIGGVIRNNISVVSGCMIGAGAVVVKDITEMGTYIGAPAVKMI